MEYMALKKPIVQYDLKEGRFSAGAASLYANNTDPVDFGDKIIWVLDHPEEGKKMSDFGYNRVLNELSWGHESEKLVNFYSRVLATPDDNGLNGKN
jgi:glycosyltransferase involved in cell wall biosynthesis